jgi:cathepsin L
LFFVLVVVCTANLNLGEKETIKIFSSWIGQHGKIYKNESEAIYRYSVWKDNLAKIIAHNEKNLGWTMTINQFGDLTAQEFADQYLTFRGDDLVLPNFTEVNVSAIASVGDLNWWRERKVAPIKNQLGCASCYAFAAVGAIESMHAIHGYPVPILSEQEMVDCDAKNGACTGGWPEYTLEYAARHGICDESAYPYKGVKQNCMVNSCSAKVRPTWYEKSTNSEANLANLLSKGPTAVCIDAREWQFYSSGVMSRCNCIGSNHCVLAVASEYGYWSLKNSWGTGFGENGFIRLPWGRYCSCIGYYSVRPYY